MWQLKDKEIDAVVKLGGPERFAYLVKKAADQESLWSLWHENGWALASDSKGQEAVPVWPHERYAALCASEGWLGYEPKQIPLDAWLDRWIPGMTKDGRLVAVFPTIYDKGVFVMPAQIDHDLRSELENYE